MGACLMDAKYVAAVFVDAINSHDVEALCLLMTDNCMFTDACGRTHHSVDSLRKAWHDTFRWFPDYQIRIERIVVDGQFVVLIGSTRAKADSEQCSAIPTVWTAEIEDNRVSSWRVYAESTFNAPLQN
jgi:ketosteroid isomerase-like protein